MTGNLYLKRLLNLPLKTKNPLQKQWVLVYMVPEARIELARTQGPLDFESSASTNFTTPADILMRLYLIFQYCQYDIDNG